MRIIQYVADLQSGDAVSDIVRAFDRLFKKWGHTASIAAAGWGEDLRGLVIPYQDLPAPLTSPGLMEILHIYHFSVACSPLTEKFRKLPGRRMVVYHNITPPEWFHGYDEAALWSTGLARAELAGLRENVDLALSYSPYNVGELRDLGFQKVDTVPFVLDFARFQVEPDQALLYKLKQDQPTNLLFVGRFAPNKCFEDVVRLFYFYHRTINRNSKLYLVGPHSIPAYVARVKGLVNELGLADSVSLPGRVSDAELAAYYRAADVFVSMSAHEGFCVPLLEAMQNSVPVLAYAAAAVPDTMGDGGILCLEKNFPVLAEMVHLLASDEALRARVISQQALRLTGFDADAAESGLRAVVEPPA
ncbi:MAG: glycosyltransferase family 4 protein [Armatimonadetes bacterium]|nr:glycosyltransferase family 4 protein [Armatimonadota bacterium]